MSTGATKQVDPEQRRRQQCGEERKAPSALPESRPDGDDVPVTHCEFCGAEYPIPGTP